MARPLTPDSSPSASLDYVYLLHEIIYDSLHDRLSFIKRPFSKVLIRGKTPEKFRGLFSDETTVILQGEQDPSRYDLILSVLEIHGLEDVMGFLRWVKKSLTEEGVFLCVFYGEDSLHELRRAFCETDLTLRKGTTPHIFPMIQLQEFAHLLQRADFALPVVDLDQHFVFFKKFWSLLRVFKSAGEKNKLMSRARGLYGLDYFAALEASYPKTGKGFPFSLDLIYGHGWSLDPSKVTPLQPGSGQISLKDVL